MRCSKLTGRLSHVSHGYLRAELSADPEFQAASTTAGVSFASAHHSRARVPQHTRHRRHSSLKRPAH